MIDTKFLDQLDRFSLIVHKRVTSNYSGTRKSVSPGHGLVIKDYRPYVVGDDFRAIDWRIYARTDHFFVKRYEEEKNLVVHIIIDGSSSMNFGKGVTKFDYASMLGIGIAYLAMKENEKFQLSTFDDKLDVFKPRKGLSQLAQAVKYLNTRKIAGKTNFEDAMKKYKRFANSKSLIVLISDFLIDMPEIENTLSMFGRQDLKVIKVIDPVERDLKLAGDFKLHDSETRSILRTFISPRLRVNYKSKLDEHSGKIKHLCNSMGADFSQIPTDMPIFEAFYRILK